MRGAAGIASMVLVATLTGGGVVANISATIAMREEQWHLEFLRIPEAHLHSKGNGVLVALIDSGVDASHPDLANSVIDGTDFSVEGSSTKGKRDLSGHGTAMAGLIAAHGEVTGVAPQAKIMPIRNGVSAGREIAQSINWAVAHGAQVICIAQVGTEDSPAQRQAIRHAVEADAVIVAGAGNLPRDAVVGYPAAYPGVVATAGIDRQGEHAAISTTGPQLAVAAPAVEIRSTGLNKGYRSGTGTSDATAIVAGVVALIRAKFPDLSAGEVTHRLTATAVDKGPKGRDSEYGYGIVDPVAALTADVPPLEGPPSPSPGTAAPPPDDDILDRVVLFGGIGLAVLILIGGLILARRRG